MWKLGETVLSKWKVYRPHKTDWDHILKVAIQLIAETLDIHGKLGRKSFSNDSLAIFDSPLISKDDKRKVAREDISKVPIWFYSKIKCILLDSSSFYRPVLVTSTCSIFLNFWVSEVIVRLYCFFFNMKFAANLTNETPSKKNASISNTSN